MAVKAYYLGVPALLALSYRFDYLRSLTAISYVDVLFAAGAWAAARVALALAGGHKIAAYFISTVFMAFAALSSVYAVANVIVFGVFGGFLTYPLLALVGSVHMLSSSVAAHLTPRVVLALVALPALYLTLVEMTVRAVPSRRPVWRPRDGVAFASLGIWVLLGQYAFSTTWATRQDRKIAQNPPWVLLSSWWQADGPVRMADRFPPEDLRDFDPLGARLPSPATLIRSISTGVANGGSPVSRRPPNVILIVLESVAARWTSLNGGLYDTTPTLKAESSQALVFDNFYAHIGRSSNSLGAILMSVYPKLDFHDLTDQYPHLPGTSLAAVFRDRGYRTAFITPSDLAWAGWDQFLKGHGFNELHDYHGLPCSDLISSWGVEDRCMVDGIINFITQDPTHPFFLMGWTSQTHHPYEPTPGVPLLDMEREPVPDQWELGHYLNVLHETDHHLGRLFDTIRRMSLDKDTLIIVVGDHGQAFGYPHNTYIQGRTVYEEDVHVPLMLWFPRQYRSAARSKIVGSHVDLAPTIATLAGLPAAPDWQGRNLFDHQHPDRAYFYVAEDHFTLGIREDNWKYIFDLREGVDELYDLARDPNEQHNLAIQETALTARLRQRLAAWTEANRRQYASTKGTH